MKTPIELCMGMYEKQLDDLKRTWEARMYRLHLEFDPTASWLNSMYDEDIETFIQRKNQLVGVILEIIRYRDAEETIQMNNAIDDAKKLLENVFRVEVEE